MELDAQTGEELTTGRLPETGGGVEGMSGLLSFSVKLMLS